MFQRLLTAKRIENSKTLSRYTVGLDKLQSSAEQVAGMQQELRVCFTPAMYCSWYCSWDPMPCMQACIGFPSVQLCIMMLHHVPFIL